MKPVLQIFIACLLLQACQPSVDKTPQVRITTPIDGVVLNNDILLEVENENENLDDWDIQSIRFEIAQANGAWELLSEMEPGDPPYHGILPEMNTLLEVDSLDSGAYRARAIMSAGEGLESISPEVSFIVNKPPTADANAQPGRQQGEVQFDAQLASDPEGSELQYLWDFGDGQTGSGVQAYHRYTRVDTSYTVALIVKDEGGAFDMQEFDLEFENGEIDWDPGAKRCICRDVQLRGDELEEERVAFGKDAKAGGETWPLRDYFDTQKLGPQDDSGVNEKLEDGEKYVTGYGFELYFEVWGDPKYCQEDQLAKGTIVRTNGSQSKESCLKVGGTWDDAAKSCTMHKAMKLRRLDKDRDGETDLDVSTREKCEAKGGKWDDKKRRCIVEFPYDGLHYASDGYRKPRALKQHVGNKIIWFDAPNFRDKKEGMTGTMKGKFVAFLRGTDGKYCYTMFTIDYVRKAGKDVETLKETARGINVGSLPAGVF